jgi:putative ABC transport system permease protein
MTVELLAREMRQACRSMWRSRGVAAAAVLTLSVGMAGALSMFTLIRGVLLRPLPLSSPDSLVVMWKELPGTRAKLPVRAAEIDPLRDAAHVFSSVATFGYNDPVTGGFVDGETTRELELARVSGNFFHVLGVRPLLGRALAPDDDGPGAELVLVLSHRVWRQQFGGDRNVIGRRLMLADQPFTVVGVMPPDVEIPRRVDAWMTVEARAVSLSNPTFQGAVRDELEVVARLGDGVTLPVATRALDEMSARLDEIAAGKDVPRGTTPVVRHLADTVVGDVRRGMFILFGAVALVLLIACANVANLLLVRAHTRHGEFAVRAALGASRLRLAGQIAAESLLLGGAAAALGLVVTWLSLRAMIAIVPLELPRTESIRIDGTVTLFALLLALVATVTSAIAPALGAMQRRVVTGARNAAGGNRSGTRGRRVLVAAQVALAVIVVVAAGLIARTLNRLEGTGAALGTDRLILVGLALPADQAADRERHARLLDEVVMALDADPLIDGATPINALPFTGIGWDVPLFSAEGQDIARAKANGSLDLEAIEPGYFETFGVPLVRGRPFDERDDADAPAVAIVSEDAAARLWPSDDALGKRLKMGAPEDKGEWMTVVGVAARTRYRDLRAPRATLYVPSEQLVVGAQSLVVRSEAPIARVADAVRARLRAIDSGVRVSRVVPFETLLAAPLARPRFYAVLLTLFGTTALLLTAIGLYGVSAASVKQRSMEIGVRLSVGATAADIRWLVQREGLWLAALGVIAGAWPAIAATRLLSGLLYEVGPLDPVALAAAVVLVFVAAAVASYVPARAASRINPLAALRAE